MTLFENVPNFRQVYLDRRTHPKDLNHTWLGHSIGRWEGDTLVIDTVGFNDKSWVLIYPHTEMLHVIERYHRADRPHLEVEATIEDPGTYAKPWSNGASGISLRATMFWNTSATRTTKIRSTSRELDESTRALNWRSFEFIVVLAFR